MKMKKNMNRLFLLVLLFCTYGMAAAQAPGGKITGTVKSDKDNEPLAGVSILVKGTNQSTITDMDGVFTIKANTGQTLVLSYIGFNPVQVVVTGSKMAIKMREAENSLDELVVIGYGTMKKKLNTGATVQVKGDELQRQNTTDVLHALQGSTPGVQITSTSGQPGQGVKMTIRGAGSIYGSNPLYIVDGVITGDISYLSSSDIASIDILKDAASSAIYGAQASNGVVLVTTRTGTKGKSMVTFDGYYGVQNIASKIEMLDAEQYALILNEMAINSGADKWYENAAGKATFLSNYAGINWLNEVTVNDAAIYESNLGISGGSENSIYSISLGLTGQDGVVGGHDVSNYQRMNFRANNENYLYDKALKVGYHINYTNTKQTGVNEGGLYSGSPIRSALGNSPFLPMYDDAGNYFNNSPPVTDSLGITTGTMYKGQIWDPWINGEANSYASMHEAESHSVNQKIFGDIYAEIQPIKNLKIKTTFGLDSYTGGNRSFVPVYKLSPWTYNNNDYASQSLNRGYTWSWDNTASYDFKIEEHAWTILAGTSIREYQGEYMYTKNADLTIADYDHAWINNAQNISQSNLWKFEGGPSNESMMLSFFTRFNYNYLEKYLLNATFRADGSSNFAKSSRRGYFPSFSAGWVLTNEDFMQDNSVVDFLKLRATWGQVGNQNVVAGWPYLATITTANTYYYFGSGVPAGSLTAPGSAINVSGAYPNQLANEALKWETSEQSGIGFDARLYNSRLGVNFDLYNKVTKDWLIVAPILATAGANAPYINGGDVTNRGVELALTWNDHIGDFAYNIGGNVSYNQNRVGNVPTEDGIIYGNGNELYANADIAYIQAQTGYPIGYFWGYKTDGIIQNATDLSDYITNVCGGTKSNSLQGRNITYGDVKYVDNDGNNMINAADKTMIGSPHPDFTFGLSLACSWKGLDASIMANGVAGNEIMQSYRDYGSKHANYTTAIMGRWHGEGTSNELPRVTETNINYHISDIFVHKGDFLRISNVQLGYDLTRTLLKIKNVSQVRVYFAVQNAFTFTSYNGMDPEIGYGTDASTSGIDLGYYPRARTILTGVNIKF